MTVTGAPGYAARWGDIESKYYSYLARNERIGETAQQDIFAGYAAQFSAGQKVLDVGSGLGDFLDLLRARGVKGFGVEADQGMVRESRARGHTIFVSDAIVYLRETRRRFDGVFMGNFVEHFSAEDVLSLVRGAHRVLRPGGKLIIATPDPRSLHVHLQEFWRDATHVRLYDRDLLAFMASVSGFGAIETGSNNATAYNPGVEWFGEDFADQLTSLNDAFMASSDRSTERGSGSTGGGDRDDPRPAAHRDGDRSAADDVDARVAHLSRALEQTQRETARTVAALREEVRAMRAAMAAREAPTGVQGDAASGNPGPDTPHIPDGQAAAPRGAGGSARMPIIGERRSAAALRRWNADGDAGWHAMFPPPYQRPPVSPPDGPVPGIALALLRDVLDETRICAAALREQGTSVAKLNARLNGLGEIVALAQQEIVQGGRAVRQRLRDLETTLTEANRRELEEMRRMVGDAILGIDDLRRARAEEAGAPNALLTRLAAESHARVAMMQTMRERIASLFGHLYPPREYFVVAVREAETVNRGVEPR